MMANVPADHLAELWGRWAEQLAKKVDDEIMGDMGIIPPASPRTAGNVIVKKAGEQRFTYCDQARCYYNVLGTKRGNNKCARKYIRLIDGCCMSYTEVRWEEETIDLTDRRVRVEE